MSFWLIVLGLLYFLLLAWAARSARVSNQSNPDEVLLAKSGIPTILLFISFSATLFSTFTLMGVPNFFRTHGVGTWIFIAVSDVTMGFVVYWFGVKYKTIVDKENIRTVSSLLKNRYNNGFAWKVYLIGIFIFLTPYVAIQIQGVSQLLTSLSPVDVPSWLWAFLMLALILVYSWIGGLRAIMYSDVAQGIILLFVIWIVAIIVGNNIGGLSHLFDLVREKSPELLSTPGPKGLMNFQFLLVSFFAILLMPITQPQLTTRIAASKSVKEIPIIALGISFFALIILLPTIIIGFVGAITYPTLSSGDFLAQILVMDRPDIIGALAIIGLMAAAMSTADSQLFALGSESQVATAKDETKLNVSSTKAIILVFALISFILSLLSNTELVLLARVSFVGTAFIAPMILLAIFSKEKELNIFVPILTFITLLIFLLISFKFIPHIIFGLRLDLILLVVLSLTTSIYYFFRKE